MKCLCVIPIKENSGWRRLLKEIGFSIPPIKGDTIFPIDGYAGFDVIYRYIGKDYIKIGMSGIEPEYIDDLTKNHGWEIK